MNVGGKHYRTVWIEEGVVCFIDQARLPFEFSISRSEHHLHTCDAIRRMLIRGAGAIGAAAGFAMAQGFLEARKEHDPENYILLTKAHIESTRPTARDLFFTTEKVFAAGLKSPEEAMRQAQMMADENAGAGKLIGEYGNHIINPNDCIGTHCNAGWLGLVDFGSALAPVYEAHRNGKKISVLVDETRPRNQGARLTAWELLNEGVPFRIIPDNAMAYFMAKGKVNLMIVGADRIAANGDVANKIGTLEKAIAAWSLGIPFYVAAPFSTIDPDCPDGDSIPIEERGEEEVLFQSGPDMQGNMTTIRVSAPGAKALNPAFDITPAKYITGIITPEGIVSPEKEKIRTLYRKKIS